MIAKQEIHQRLVLLESKLHDRPEAAGEVRAILQILDNDESDWIDTVGAQRLLDAHSVTVIEAWAKQGWLRSKQLPDGQLKVSLADVLERRETDRALSAMGSIDTPLTDVELELMRTPSTPEVEAIVGAIVALAEERLKESSQASGK